MTIDQKDQQDDKISLVYDFATLLLYMAIFGLGVLIGGLIR